jgi:hypothetical protein
MKRHYRPLLELLENRTLLATCHVTRLGDFGAGADIGGGHSRGDLRYCITKANTQPGPDAIEVNVSGTIQLAGALPGLTTEMEIVGPGSSNLTVRRNSGGDYRIFTIGAGAVVRISGLTATNGYITSGSGGGIHNQGTLTLIDTKINANRAQSGNGGGIYNNGALLIKYSVIASNFAEVHGYESAFGGGIRNEGWLSIIGSAITQNKSIARADFSYASGAGISNTGSVHIDYSTISNNYAESYGSYAESRGGGVDSSRPLAITNSTVSGNHADAYPDEIGMTYGGGINACSVSPQMAHRLS